MTTTCQICAREIKAKSGVIAHHGYKRPRLHWQTASCFGARYRPYEVACDALPKAITSCQAFIDRQTAWLTDWMANPPATIEVAVRKFGGYQSGEKRTYTRPEKFDADASGSYSPRTYEAAFRAQRDDARRAIKDATQSLNFMKQRLADWHAPKCLCGAATVGAWTAGVHHGEDRCARVITKMGESK